MAFKAPKIPSFFHTPKHRRFDYTPISYNPEEEKRKISAYRNILPSDQELKDLPNTDLLSFRRSEKRGKNIRLAIIVCVLACATYMLIK
ncbi:MAG: hypothetical protein HRT72_11540 [Flavobacteriales bacterium]|nr:hypothetical protein [Flavobacteriales bacterium]